MPATTPSGTVSFPVTDQNLQIPDLTVGQDGSDLWLSGLIVNQGGGIKGGAIFRYVL